MVNRPECKIGDDVDGIAGRGKRNVKFAYGRVCCRGRGNLVSKEIGFDDSSTTPSTKGHRGVAPLEACKMLGGVSIAVLVHCAANVLFLAMDT